MDMHFNLVRVTGLLLLYLAANHMAAQRSQIRTYTVGDGLVMNRVRGFHQDKDGFIWIYTWDGLSRYEGYRFRNYLSGRELRHSFVNDILDIGDDKMYLALNDGSLAVLHDEVVERITVHGDIMNGFCVDDKGQIFVATDYNGIQLLKNDTLVPLCDVPISTIIQAIHYNGHFFFIGAYAGPSGVLDDQFRIAATWEGPTAFFTELYQDHNGRIFVCTADGLREVDFTSAFQLKEVAELPSDAPWLHWQTSSVIVTSDNDFWIGTNQGLVHLRSDGSWNVLTIQSGLLSNQISALFEDSSHTLWIGTDAGVASVNLQTTIDDNRDLPGVYCNFILPAGDGYSYTVTGQSFLNTFDQHLHLIKSEFIGQDAAQGLGIDPEHQSLLLIRQKEVEKLPEQSMITPAYTGTTYTGYQDRFWAVSGSAILCADSYGQLHPLTEPRNYPLHLVQQRDLLIVGTLEHGVLIGTPDENPDSCKINIIRDLSEWNEDHRIRSLFVSKDGALWIGTRYGGVTRLDCNDDFSECTKQTFRIKDGLISNWITAIAEDSLGNIWVGSASGLDKLIPRGETYFAFPFSRTHDFYANVRYLMCHPDGSIWVGHNEGLARIMDGRVDTIGAPLTYLTEVSLGGLQHQVLPSPDPVRLRYDQNSVHFAYTAPDYINTSQNTFSYRLITDRDTSWSPPVKTHEIFYGNLMPGTFTFEVAAYGWNGDRGIPVSYSFRIMRPFWKQGWFLALLLLITGAILFILYRLRISQIQNVQSVRNRIAADLHDEIGSSLTHINILSEIGRQEYPRDNGGPDLFERIGSEVQTSSEALDDIIWSIRTRRDAIGDVIARMRQYAHEIFEPAGISIQLHESVEGIQSLEMEFKRDFYLIYKELLRNVLKHAGARHVDIEIEVGRSNVSIIVTDDGKGFAVDRPTDRSGLPSIRSRAERWKGSASWISTPGHGTKVIVEMQPF